MAASAKKNNKGDILFLGITGVFFIALFIIFLFLPRPVYSELEKRELGSFPRLEDHKENLSGFTASISDWFSNTQPFRDQFLTMSMRLRNSLKLSFRDDMETVSFIATSDDMNNSSLTNEIIGEGEETQKGNADQNAKVANAGIVVLGNPPNVRAMMAYGGSRTSGSAFVSTVNEYARSFPSQNIYVVVASSSGEFYMPEKVSRRHKPEGPTLDYIREQLNPGVNYVNVHDALAAHKDEDIFLRTDHHWAPLGAFYAAKELAKTANLPFKDLNAYDEHTLHGYVGSMYGYSKDISVKNSPEDFIYHTPRGLNYKTLFIAYKTNSDFQVTGATAPFQSQFFKSYKDGSGAAYCTFMGGDQNLVHISTGSPSKRKILIIKDSFGNALPGYLFFSFSDIHVVDFRYFHRNVKKYVEEKGITDIAFVFNIFNVCNGNTVNKVKAFLNQKDGSFAREESMEESQSGPGNPDSLIKNDQKQEIINENQEITTEEQYQHKPEITDDPGQQKVEETNTTSKEPSKDKE